MRAALALLSVLALGLAGLIAWQLTEAAPEPPGLPRTAAPDRAVAPMPAVPGADPAGLAAASLARPLFNPERRPPAPGMAAGPAAPAPLPRLTGILVTPGGRSAIFAGMPQALVVHEGATVGGFIVGTIEPGQVTLQGPAGPRVLRPSLDPNRPAPPSAAPPSAAPPGADGLPGPFPAGPNAPQDAMPFDQNPAPSGLDIIRSLAPRGQGAPAPAR